MNEKLVHGGGSGIMNPSLTGFVSTFCSFSSVETAANAGLAFHSLHFTFEFCLCHDLAHFQPFTEQF